MPFREYRPSVLEQISNNTRETIDTVCYLANQAWAYIVISWIGEEQYYAHRNKQRRKQRDQENPFRLSRSRNPNEAQHHKLR